MVLEELKKYKIILASRSPRRKELLEGLGLDFRIVARDWVEDYPGHLKKEEIALYVAAQKAANLRSEINDNEIVITADTIVWCNDKVLGKPKNDQDARKILKEISGNTHKVITGVCLLSAEREALFFSSTEVTFSELNEDEIDYYIRNFSPFDKAGAYGIQEWIGLAACIRIEGSYFNVMGLPVEKVYHELQKFIK
jgi:septum formation protein